MLCEYHKQETSSKKCICYMTHKSTISGDKALHLAFQTLLSLATRGSSDERYESARMHAGKAFCQTDT